MKIVNQILLLLELALWAEILAKADRPRDRRKAKKIIRRIERIAEKTIREERGR